MPTPRHPATAAAAEQAFASSGSLSDILHTALAAPLSRIGTGALGATERRRLIESGAVGDADAADELVEIAARGRPAGGPGPPLARHGRPW